MQSDDGAATIALMDVQGRRRIVIEVKTEGFSSLTFQDANGKVLNQLLPFRSLVASPRNRM
jgi:hypothetical protein